jgi:hypothetical protein
MKDKTIYSIGNMQIGDKIIVELITNEIAALQYEQIAFFRYAKINNFWCRVIDIFILFVMWNEILIAIKPSLFSIYPF